MEQYDREADMRAWVMRYGSGSAAYGALSGQYADTLRRYFPNPPELLETNE